MLFGDIPGHEMWGNDGLVTLQSARWGQFLGVMEECDHWALRGATGKESGVELGTSVSEPSEDRATAPNREVPGGGAGEDGWALGDWARFVRAWKREEKKAKAEEESIAAAAMAGVSDRSSFEPLSSERSPRNNNNNSSGKEEAKEKEKGRLKDNKKEQTTRFLADDVVKASTEKLSAVFDWIVEQVPSRTPAANTSSSSPPPSPSPSSSSSLSSSSSSPPPLSRQPPPVSFYLPNTRDRNDSSSNSSSSSSSSSASRSSTFPRSQPGGKSELSSGEDLERFYVALCRQLYDEGL